jgi:hypothetical protein
MGTTVLPVVQKGIRTERDSYRKAFVQKGMIQDEHKQVRKGVQDPGHQEFLFQDRSPIRNTVIHNITKSSRSGGGTAVLLKNYRSREWCPAVGFYTYSSSSEGRDKSEPKNRILLFFLGKSMAK